MENIDLMQYIVKEAMPIVAALLVLGAFIKRIPKIQDWMIPFILLAAGIIFANLILGFSVDSVLQGIIAAGMSVYTNQLGKQVYKGINKK